MDEADFWLHLEYRVCTELAGAREKELRAWWCDGFIVGMYESERGRITGRVWMGQGPRHQEPFEFTLQLTHAKEDREQVDWARLLPGDEITDWLSIDFDKKVLAMDPGRSSPVAAFRRISWKRESRHRRESRRLR